MTKPEIAAPAQRIARAAASAALALAGTCALGAGWQLLPSPSLSIDLNTVGPSTQYPGATGVWLDYAPGLSVDCSPPAGCYAYKQRIYYVFTCTPRWAATLNSRSIFPERTALGPIIDRMTAPSGAAVGLLVAGRRH